MCAAAYVRVLARTSGDRPMLAGPGPHLWLLGTDAAVAPEPAHDGTPDAPVSATRGRGVHGSRMKGGDATPSRAPLRFVLPAGALD